MIKVFIVFYKFFDVWLIIFDVYSSDIVGGKSNSFLEMVKEFVVMNIVNVDVLGLYAFLFGIFECVFEEDVDICIVFEVVVVVIEIVIIVEDCCVVFVDVWEIIVICFVCS